MKYCLLEATQNSSLQLVTSDLHFECVGEVVPGGVQLGAEPRHRGHLEAALVPLLPGDQLQVSSGSRDQLSTNDSSPGHGLDQPGALVLHGLQLRPQLVVVAAVTLRALQQPHFILEVSTKHREYSELRIIKTPLCLIFSTLLSKLSNRNTLLLLRSVKF